MSFNNILNYNNKLLNYDPKYGNYIKIVKGGANSFLLHISNNYLYSSDKPLKCNKNINVLNADTIEILLKFQKEKKDDNLFIEYLNGLYVNKLANYFPNVVRTIGLFEIDDKHHKEYSQDNINLKYINKINIDKKTLDEKPDDILKYLNCSNSNKHYFISKCNCFCFNFF